MLYSQQDIQDNRLRARKEALLTAVLALPFLAAAIAGFVVRAELLCIAGCALLCAVVILMTDLRLMPVVRYMSDRLTPWETIEKRLAHAAQADLAIALYNPASRSRPEHLKRACDILLRFLPENRLCGIARNIGRAGESCRMLTLGELREAEVDMFCTVLIGNAMTKTIGGRLITPRGYKNV